MRIDQLWNQIYNLSNKQNTLPTATVTATATAVFGMTRLYTKIQTHSSTVRPC